MRLFLRSLGFAVAISIVGSYALFALRGPQGLPVLVEKQREIRELQEQNADLVRENQRKLERIGRLKTSRAEQELEIRDRLKMLRPGERSVILPGGADSAK